MDAHRRRRRFTVLVAACCVALIPWIAFLVATLPRHYVASHWRLAWVGYDIALLIALGLCAYRGWRRRPNFPTTAVVTATLLTVDAWFDVVTASGRTDRLLSLAAALFELPLAALLAVAARRTRRLRDEGAPGWATAPPATGPSFGDGAVAESSLEDGAVAESSLEDGAVAGSSFEDGAVAGSCLEDGRVTESQDDHGTDDPR